MDTHVSQVNQGRVCINRHVVWRYLFVALHIYLVTLELLQHVEWRHLIIGHNVWITGNHGWNIGMGWTKFYQHVYLCETILSPLMRFHIGLSIIEHITIFHLHAQPQKYVHHTVLAIDRTSFFLNRTIDSMTEMRSITRVLLWIVHLDGGEKTGTVHHESSSDASPPHKWKKFLWSRGY